MDPRRGQMATVLYARVSTVDQTIEHQRTQAEKAGFIQSSGPIRYGIVDAMNVRDSRVHN
jgi:DNA invertase Pin-like site-specific DNA recombinase